MNDELDKVAEIREDYSLVIDDEFTMKSRRNVVFLLSVVDNRDATIERLLDGYPEGETPTDVRMLKQANLELASEVENLRRLLREASAHLGCFIDTLEEDLWAGRQHMARGVLERIREELKDET